MRLALAAILIVVEAIASPVSIAYALAVAYGLFSAGVLAHLARRAGGAPPLGPAPSVVDVAAAAALTVVANQPVVHFFPLFVLVSAAYRGGVVQTVASGAVMAGALVLETHPAVEGVFGEAASPSHIFVLGGYTLVVAVLVGHLAQRERGARGESAAVGHLFEHLRLDTGPVASLGSVLDQVRVIFGARQVLLAVDNSADDVMVLWRTRDGSAAARRGPVFERLGSSDQARYWFPMGMVVDACLFGRTGSVMRVAAAVDESGAEVPAPAIDLRNFARAHPASRVFVLSHLAVGSFRLRLFILDPLVQRADEQLRLLQTLVGRVTPVVHNLFLERHLRTHLKEDERARLARELHDGLIQSLIAIEMRLEVARRQVESAPARAAADIGETQHQLREQIVDVRTLMHQLRPPDVDHRRLVQRLSESTDRFRQTTGIEARFDGTVDRLELPARVCSELVRVVDEALMNVRKHSGARRVAVHLGANSGALTLSVEDDGRGFDFTGRMTQPDLDALGLGPLVIKERVQALGGCVAIDSRPGRGARLEVQVPRHAPGVV